MSEPIFKHDCAECVYLGTYDDRDLYFCAGEPTVIARYGNVDYEYKSGLCFAEWDRNKHLYIAKLIAIDKGLL